ncbi:ComEC/Rec2 family competence protein [Pseudomonas syringae]|uniref:ComEC/Rec2 family competence protein n=1 Tax=Pseudomonas syringae TaxID=317 RepID=UPI001F0EDFE3|nr:MBL fold metallo-hydrolase [Pseudomonas syringae]MCH5514099.1 MBL fold metallo-hydrolase [Pseudomonas syringae pv. syringae]MCH5628075.1 MBL fold metallo-hydrolase [Pseudomonas syringae pv. syringae]
MSIRVRFLQANHGDSILITHEGSDGVFNVLIDGGNGATFRHGPRARYAGALCLALDELKAKNQKINLAILTHIDDDHIEGLKRAFAAPGYLAEMVKSIWFNSSRMISKYFNSPEIPENDIYLSNDSPETTVEQGRELEALLTDIGCERVPVVMAGQIHVEGPFKFTILSPDKEKLQKLLHKWHEEIDSGETTVKTTDYSLSLDEIWLNDSFQADTSVYNGSSIAFILEADGKSMLFLGDSHDEIIVRNLRALGFSEQKKLEVELVKISHHGSQHNTSSEFLSLINSPRYVVSTNGSKHGLPDKRTIARILASSEGKILFNYSNVVSPLLLKDEVLEYISRLEVIGNDIRLLNDNL